MSKRVALDTLGCKLNQAETEDLSRQFSEAGYEVVSSPGEADIYVLNTCTVTHIADRKSRHLLRMAHRLNPDSLVIATGCYAERAHGEISSIPGVGLVLGNREKSNILRILSNAGYTGCSSTGDNTPQDNRCNGHRTRSIIKVQDGCSLHCSYCIVPFVRGREKSIPADRVIDDVRQRVACGYREIVLTGVRVGSYRSNRADLAVLIERILQDTDVERLRLSSLQPGELSTKLIGLWRDERLCPHFHICLQSGSDSILEKMGRSYSRKEFEQSISFIRKEVPRAAITTDVMVGFPGENTQEYEESYNFCQQMDFARIHVFPYSRRSGTEAARLPGQVDERVKRKRAKGMLSLAKASARKFRQQFLDRSMEVLFEQESGGIWSGLTANYIRVYSADSHDLTNTTRNVKLLEPYRDGMRGGIEPRN